jgi:hypothetical protein
MTGTDNAVAEFLAKGGQVKRCPVASVAPGSAVPGDHLAVARQTMLQNVIRDVKALAHEERVTFLSWVVEKYLAPGAPMVGE